MFICYTYLLISRHHSSQVTFQQKAFVHTFRYAQSISFGDLNCISGWSHLDPESHNQAVITAQSSMSPDLSLLGTISVYLGVFDIKFEHLELLYNEKWLDDNVFIIFTC